MKTEVKTNWSTNFPTANPTVNVPPLVPPMGSEPVAPHPHHIVPPIGCEPVAPHPHHLPPHLRHSMINISFDEDDWDVLIDAFDGEENATIAAEIIKSAPPEIQVSIMQTVNMIHTIKEAN